MKDAINFTVFLFGVMLLIVMTLSKLIVEVVWWLITWTQARSKRH